MNLLKFLPTIFIYAAFCIQVFAEPDPNFHIYIAFGQSNMEGQAAVEPGDKTVNNRFKIIASTTCSDPSRTNGVISSAIPPLFHCSSTWAGNSGGGYSLLDNFGTVMTNRLPEVTVGVIPVAIAGTAITLFDKTGYSSYAASAASYMQSRISDYGGNPYKRIIDLGKTAKEVGVIKGILLHQGETDAYSASWATAVKKIYNDILTDLNLSADSVPLIAGEVLSPGQCSGANTQIDALPNTIPTAHIVKSSGLSGQQDNLHFTHESYKTLGERYATTMLSLLKASGTSSSSGITSSSSSSIESSSSETTTPYKEHTIPGKIEAEDYDLGGQGIAFNDTDRENATNIYRNDNAGIDSANGAFVYGWVAPGEWLKYTVNISQTAVYDYKVRVASSSENASFTLYVDDFSFATITVPNTASWKTFEEISGTTTILGAGKHVLKLSVDAAYFNIDWIELKLQGSESIAKSTIPMEKCEKYEVYSLKGEKITTFITSANTKENDWKAIRKNLPSGTYLLKSSKLKK